VDSDGGALSIAQPAAHLALAALGVVLLGFAQAQPRDAASRYAGALALFWGGAGALAGWPTPALPGDAVDFAAAPVAAVATALAIQFLLSFVDLRARAIEAVLAAQCVVVPASVWLAGASHWSAMGQAWMPLFVLELLGAMAFVMRVRKLQQRRDFWPMAALFAAIAATLLAALAVQRGWLAEPRVALAGVVLPLLMCAVALRVLAGFANRLREAERERAGFDARLKEVTDELERKHEALVELRVEQVTQKERKRIAADLHDDLGAKLLTIVHTSESDRISTLAREALEEMRLSVRGLTGRPMQLADALADWRAEVVSRLGQANIEIDWRSPAEETDVQLAARSYVQTTRILREAVSNIIKHSGASHCKVRCAITDEAFGINIQDNGKGIPLEVDGRLDRGHGMSSMKQRAKQMLGQCLVESGPGYGTVIRLTLPLHPGA
jgi:signal transduction histidine kinase